MLPALSLLLLAPLAARAAECYAQSNGSNCVDLTQLKAHQYAWCSVNWNYYHGDFIGFTDSNGHTAWIGKIGNFQSEADCEFSYNSIIETCFGSRNGGSWTAGGVSLNIDFCDW
ncbi:hypothetical protein ESCO_002467 [Escovopsis weberi]|uniref:Uncharacterized protein n=1 Tax=Escovopsis weberi TaxID=150374 RepID=A0A0M9VSH9_ESCWE|nr:hypothetical protein ESCO_002467 [Escovopsis weberi]